MGKGKRIGLFIVSSATFASTSLGYISTCEYIVMADEEYDSEFEAYLDEQGFPESYRPYLRELHKLHPNWDFQAFQTGLDWDYVVENEMEPANNIIPQYTYYATSLFDTVLPGSFNWEANTWGIISAPYWVQVSEEGLCYYMDPRNWLQESTIFMFELLSFNEGSQTIEGVEQVLKGTFMENAYIDIYGNGTDDNPYIESENLYATDSFVAGIEPGTKVKAVLEKLSLKTSAAKIEILNSDGSAKKKKDIVGTGDLVSVYKESASGKEVLGQYSILIFGDVDGNGVLNSRDRAYLKGYVKGVTKLTDIQIKAADINQDGNIDSVDRAYLKGYMKGITSISQEIKHDNISYAEAFYRIGKEINISPYHLAARVRQEQGVYGTSPNISGTVSGSEGYYNYFNIRATGKTTEEIVANAMIEAKSEGWNTRYKALYGGSVKLATGHIWKGQDTLYLQKFDVDGTYYDMFWHQYMQNVVAPYSESSNTYRTYESFGVLDKSFTFKIPVYENMPEEASPEPVKTGNPNTRLKSLTVKGYEFDFAYNTFSYSISVPKTTTKLTVSAESYADTTSISGTGTIKINQDTKYITVVTTAENGDQLTYTININRL